MALEDAILNYVKNKNGGVSFAELCSRINGFEGEYEFGILNKNIVFWHCISIEAIKSIGSLFSEKKIKIEPCAPLIYIIDGRYPALPVAKHDIGYKSSRWLPVVFNLPNQSGQFLSVDSS
jgi:hypothetical protein